MKFYYVTTILHYPTQMGGVVDQLVVLEFLKNG